MHQTNALINNQQPPQNGLAARGFTCKRIHTYNTLPVEEVDTAAMQQACDASVVTFASPSAVKYVYVGVGAWGCAWGCVDPSSPAQPCHLQYYYLCYVVSCHIPTQCHMLAPTPPGPGSSCPHKYAGVYHSWQWPVSGPHLHAQQRHRDLSRSTIPMPPACLGLWRALWRHWVMQLQWGGARMSRPLHDGEQRMFWQ